jgi:hypothetical protein
VAERAFWSDDFDMDLPKIFPDARKMLGDLGDIELMTSGTPCSRTGRLNHPCVWNHDDGRVAFFGFGNPGRDTNYYVAPRTADITCTAWEAFRDAWAHSFVMVIDRQFVWDTAALWPRFEAIMWDLRGWGETKNPRYARIKAKASYAEAIRRFGRIVNNRRAAGRTLTVLYADGGPAA